MAALNAGISPNITPTVAENPMAIEITQIGTAISTMSGYNDAELQMARPSAMPTPPPTSAVAKGNVVHPAGVPEEWGTRAAPPRGIHSSCNLRGSLLRLRPFGLTCRTEQFGHVRLLQHEIGIDRFVVTEAIDGVYHRVVVQTQTGDVVVHVHTGATSHE